MDEKPTGYVRTLGRADMDSPAFVHKWRLVIRSRKNFKDALSGVQVFSIAAIAKCERCGAGASASVNDISIGMYEMQKAIAPVLEEIARKDDEARNAGLTQCVAHVHR